MLGVPIPTAAERIMEVKRLDMIGQVERTSRAGKVVTVAKKGKRNVEKNVRSIGPTLVPKNTDDYVLRQRPLQSSLVEMNDVVLGSRATDLNKDDSVLLRLLVQQMDQQSKQMDEQRQQMDEQRQQIDRLLQQREGCAPVNGASFTHLRLPPTGAGLSSASSHSAQADASLGTVLTSHSLMPDNEAHLSHREFSSNPPIRVSEPHLSAQEMSNRDDGGIFGFLGSFSSPLRNPQ